MSGSASERLAVVTPSARSLPPRICSMEARQWIKSDLHVSGNQVREHWPGAAIGHGTCTKFTPVVIRPEVIGARSERRDLNHKATSPSLSWMCLGAQLSHP